MDQIELAIVLLTILVTVLTLVLIVLIVLVVLVLNKVNKVVEDTRQITDNLSSATAWLSPTTVFSAAIRAFRGNK
jgi:uncharacterized protein YoxC